MDPVDPSWLDNNWEWIAASILYAVERFTAFRSRRKQEQNMGNRVTEGAKPRKGSKVRELLFDLLPILSRVRGRERK